TTTPSSSQTTRSPGLTVTPATTTGWPTTGGPFLPGARGVTPRHQTLTNSATSALSRMRPSVTTPRNPFIDSASATSPPITAAVDSAAPPTTRIGPLVGPAASAWRTARLSPFVTWQVLTVPT